MQVPIFKKEEFYTTSRAQRAETWRKFEILSQEAICVQKSFIVKGIVQYAYNARMLAMGIAVLLCVLMS